jgi:hypothetical protein
MCGQGGTRPEGTCRVYIPHSSPCRPMMSIENITNVPIVRDDTAANHSQIGQTRVIPIDPATSHLLGSIMYDRKHGFNLEWDSKEAFKDWLDNEQTEKSIDLRPSKIERGSALYTTNHIFRCARNGTGGLKPYQKKTTRQRKIKSKWIVGGCPSLVQIKTYPHTSTVLGKYISNHSHAIGMENLKFIRMHDSTREMIARMVRYGKNDKNVVSDLPSDNN